MVKRGGEGGLGQSKKSLLENAQIFLPKGGEGLTQSKRVFIRFITFTSIRKNIIQYTPEILREKKVFAETIRGGVKKLFFYFRSKRGGGLGQSKKTLSEKTQFF